MKNDISFKQKFNYINGKVMTMMEKVTNNLPINDENIILDKI